MEAVNNEDLARLEATVNNSVVAVEHLKQKEDGVYRYRNNGTDISPPLCLLKYPITTAEGTDEMVRRSTPAKKGTYTAEATEEKVDVPLGKFDAVKVVIKLEQGSARHHVLVCQGHPASSSKPRKPAIVDPHGA